MQHLVKKSNITTSLCHVAFIILKLITSIERAFQIDKLIVREDMKIDVSSDTI